MTDVSLIESTLGVSGNDLQVVARVGGQLAQISRDSTGLVESSHFLCKRSFGYAVADPGKLREPGWPRQLRARDARSRQEECRITGATATRTWHGPNAFADGSVRSVSLIQSNYGQNFEVVARRNCSLVHYWRSDASVAMPWTWSGATAIHP